MIIIQLLLFIEKPLIVRNPVIADEEPSIFIAINCLILIIQNFREEKIYLEFYNLTATPQRAFIIFTAKDGGTMLRKKHMEEMYKIDRLLNGPLNITDENGRRMCEPLCNINLPLYFFWVRFFC